MEIEVEVLPGLHSDRLMDLVVEILNDVVIASRDRLKIEIERRTGVTVSIDRLRRILDALVINGTLIRLPCNLYTTRNAIRKPDFLERYKMAILDIIKSSRRCKHDSDPTIPINVTVHEVDGRRCASIRFGNIIDFVCLERPNHK